MPAKNAGPNLTRRLIDIPAANDAGGFKVVSATGPVRAWRIQESIVKSDGTALSAEGFQVKIPNDGTAAPGFNTTFQRPAYSTANEPGEFPSFENWNRISEHGPHGEVFGGAGNPDGASVGATVATVLFEIASLTNTATSIELVEYF